MSGLVAAGRSHTGLVRPHNEDAFVCAPERGLLAVIDGMGGEAAGEVAAGITRDHLLRGAELRQAIADANAAILTRGEINEEEGGMGCVATAAKLSGSLLVLAHVGDTRAYLISAAGLEQLTRDHTVVAEVRERHGMTEEEARALPGQHRITRDIGGNYREGLDWIDKGEVELQSGDLLLLCSDGLHDLVRDGELSRILGQARSEQEAPEDVVSRLIELALSRGGHDNITVVIARFEGGQQPPLPRTGPRPKRSLTRILLALFLAVLAFFFGRLSVIESPAPQELPVPVPVIVQQPLPLQWAIPEGQAMTITGVTMRAPGVTIEVEMAAGSRLIIEDATLVLEAMIVHGPEDAEVQISASLLNIRGNAPEMNGPILTMEAP